MSRISTASALLCSIIHAAVCTSQADDVFYRRTLCVTPSVRNSIATTFEQPAELREAESGVYRVTGNGVRTVALAELFDTGSFLFEFGYFVITPDLMAIEPVRNKEAWAIEALGNAVPLIQDLGRDDDPATVEETTTVDLPGGTLIGFYLFPNNFLGAWIADAADGDMDGDGSVLESFAINGSSASTSDGNRWPLFSISDANPGQLDQCIRLIGRSAHPNFGVLGTEMNLLAWEDLTRIGLTDAAFNDVHIAVVGIEPTSLLPPVPPRIAVGWGNNRLGQLSIPVGLTNVSTIAAGFAHSLALSETGEVEAWGDNRFRQIEVPASASSGVLAVAAGGMHSLALRCDRTVVGWGDNSLGQAAPPVGLTDVIAIAAGGEHSLALKGDGTVVGWGENSFQQGMAPAGLRGVVAVAAGGRHNLALLGDGTVRAWGDNSEEQINVPRGLNQVVAVAAGSFHSLALRNDGTVISWGNQSFPSRSKITAGLRDVTQIAAGADHSVALLRDGRVVAWGSNQHTQTNVLAGLTDALAISAGGYQSFAIVRRPPRPYLESQPRVKIVSAKKSLLGFELEWIGGWPQYAIEFKAIVDPAVVWSRVAVTSDSRIVIPVGNTSGYYRVLSLQDCAEPMIYWSQTTDSPRYEWLDGASAVDLKVTLPGFGVDAPVNVLRSGRLPLNVIADIRSDLPVPAGRSVTVEMFPMSFNLVGGSGGYRRADEPLFRCEGSSPSLNGSSTQSLEFQLGGANCRPRSTLPMPDELPCGMYEVVYSIATPLGGSCGDANATHVVQQRDFIFVRPKSAIEIKVTFNPDSWQEPVFPANPPPYPSVFYCGIRGERVAVYNNSPSRSDTVRTHEIDIQADSDREYFINACTIQGVCPPIQGPCEFAEADLVPRPDPKETFFGSRKLFYEVTAPPDYHGQKRFNWFCIGGEYQDDVDLTIIVMATDGCSFAVYPLRASAIYEPKVVDFSKKFGSF